MLSMSLFSTGHMCYFFKLGRKVIFFVFKELDSMTRIYFRVCVVEMTVLREKHLDWNDS